MRAAIIMLSCNDYEAIEVSLANHCSFLPEDVPFFILQNCRGTYDSERTLAAAQRYAKLFPRKITVIDNIAPGPPYRSILTFLASDHLSNIDFVCKVDDDVFPISDGWFHRLWKSYLDGERSGVKPVAYTTPLINNNTWGFAETLRVLGLWDDYLRDIARDHLVGSGAHEAPIRLLSREEICTGTNGTIWGASYLARWIHERTTLQPDRFIAATNDLPCVDIPSADRYSIGCILFRKELWSRVDDGGGDDEGMLHSYCRLTESRIICDRSVPFVHFAYFSQREENRDIVESARRLYEKRLKLPFPLGMRASRELEIESRLRWLEGVKTFAIAPTGQVGVEQHPPASVSKQELE